MIFSQSQPNRDQILRTGQGVLSETGDRQVYRSAIIMVDGRVYYQGIGLAAGDVVTNVMIQVTTGGTGTSLSKLGLYDKSGNRLALSADQGSNWNSAGVKVVAMIAAYTVPTSDLYYLAAVAKTATTMPTVIAGVSGDPLAVGSFPILGATQSAQTDLPSPGTITGSSNISPWLACS